MAQGKDQLVLGYWAIRGLAEPTRLALHYTKTPFTDKFYYQGEGPDYSRDEWLSEKYNIGLDFPNLPYLFDGDLKLTQSKAILYYLGRKHNLMGKTPKEEALVMMLCEQAHDLRLQFNGLCYGPKGDSDADQKHFLETTATNHLQQIDAYLGKHKGKFAVGDQPTVADFQLFDYIDCIFTIDHGHIVLGKFANIEKLLKTIRELPELKDYIVKSQSELPLNNKVAKLGGKIIARK